MPRLREKRHQKPSGGAEKAIARHIPELTEYPSREPRGLGLMRPFKRIKTECLQKQNRVGKLQKESCLDETKHRLGGEEMTTLGGLRENQKTLSFSTKFQSSGVYRGRAQPSALLRIA